MLSEFNFFSQLNLKHIGTYFSLLNSKVITSENEHTLRTLVDKTVGVKEPQKLTREAFIKLPMWFDATENSPTLHSKN